MKKFIFELGNEATLLSGEKGDVIGRADYIDGEPSYRIRYVAGDGRLTESWWGESALKAPATS